MQPDPKPRSCCNVLRTGIFADRLKRARGPVSLPGWKEDDLNGGQSAPAAQNGLDSCVSASLRIFQRRTVKLTVGSLDLHVGSGIDKQSDNLGAIIDDREHQRRKPVLCRMVQLRAALDKKLCELNIAAIHRVHEGALPVLVEGINVGSCVQQRLNPVKVP